MPRFVILRHEMPPGHPRSLHWDVMLEAGGALRTWALAEEPQPGKPIAAEPLADHRLLYLDYEGPISQDRGAVERWDFGEYTMIEESPARIAVALRGNVLRGTALFVTGVREGRGSEWTFQFDVDAAYDDPSS